MVSQDEGIGVPAVDLNGAVQQQDGTGEGVQLGGADDGHGGLNGLQLLGAYVYNILSGLVKTRASGVFVHLNGIV